MPQKQAVQNKDHTPVGKAGTSGQAMQKKKADSGADGRAPCLKGPVALNGFLYFEKIVLSRTR